MSLRYEQYRALALSRELLRELVLARHRSIKIKELRRRARHCLKHFPFLAENGKPLFSPDRIPAPPPIP